MSNRHAAALAASRSISQKRARAALFSLFALERFEDRLAFSVSYSIAPGGTLDIFPLSQIIPAGMDRIEVRLQSVPGTTYGHISRMAGLTEIPWGSGAPNVFTVGDGNNRINGGEGFRYYANSNADGQVEVIPIRFRNNTGFVSQDETISISINSHLTPPVITQQPTTFIQVGVGGTATMSVQATGATAPTYQWFTGIAPNASNPIAGATSSTYTTPPLSTVAQYMYWCRVRNSDGVANSDTVTVQVATPTTTTTSNVTTIYSAAAHTVNVSAQVSPANNVGAVTFQILGLGVYKQSATVVNGSSGNVALDIPAGAAPGTYTMTAQYDAPAGIASSVDTKTFTIEKAATTTVASSASGTASTSGQTVTLNAAVSSTAGAITSGTVTFSIRDQNANVIGSSVSANVSNGTATASYALPANTRAGQYSITATYNGNAIFAASTDGGSRTFTQAPYVATSAAPIRSNSTSITINGSGFSSTPGDNVVNFTPGMTGSVTSASATQLVYTFTNPPTPGAQLKASVSTAGISSGASVQVATVEALPDLSVAVSHQGNFVAGSNTNVYRIGVSAAAGSTLSEVVLTGTLPAGMTAASLTGAGWTISQGTGSTVIARRSDTLAAGTTYPVLALAVNVPTGASAAVVPTFVVSGGGDVTIGNNTATDSTVLAESPSLVVNSAADTNSTADNQTSLREAVADAQRSTSLTGFDGWSINRGASSVTSPFVTTGLAPINDNLQITAAEGGQGNSAWSSQRVNVNSFSASFTYTQNAGTNGADGFAFAFQNAGVTATGAPGGGLGIGTLAGAAGIAFNIYSGYGVGFKSFVNGTLSGSYTAFGNGVSLTSGVPINFTISGNGTTVTLTATQGSNTFTTSLPMDIAASVGGNGAYVGFTGGTGGANAQQTISKVSITAAALPATVTFDAALAGQTLTLSQAGRNNNDDETRSALIIDGDVTIAGPTGGAGITLAIASGVQKRHLLVNAAGTLTVSNLTFTNGYANVYGGAIWSFGSLTVRNSTFTGNYAETEGGAIQTWGGSKLLRLENSTIAGNSSGNRASAIGTGSTNVSIDHSTIVDNTAANPDGAIWVYQTALTMRDSIVARNSNDGVLTNGGNATGTFSASSTNNLVGVGNWPGLNAATNRLNTAAADLRLGTLANNGGSTMTVALMPGSPAINAAMPIASITADQRGMARTQGSAPDIGAYERQATAATIGGIAMEYDSRLAATLTFNLDASVTFSRTQIQLQNLTSNTAVASDVGAFDFDSTGTHATLTLNNQLPDGNYRLTAPGAAPVDFFVLRGDFNRDRTVNFNDLVTLAQNYGKTGLTLSGGDSNYDGKVDFNDLVAVSQNYGKTLLVPLAVTSTGAADRSVNGSLRTKNPGGSIVGDVVG